ncbi:MAG: InlB B-repeat-containing protein [Mogibacterium sp.]|nr:InlB B-repeat-containing protein [Mogibacterium sp.]
MMSRKNSRYLSRICCIASVLILMLGLCGCRTRLSNNDEVLSVVYDEDVFMSAEYQMRRDELGLDKAKKPFFNGFSSPEEPEEDYDDYDVGRLEDYDPAEEEEEPEILPQSEKPKKKRAGGGGGTLSRNNDDEGESDPEPQEIVVTLDPNGGKCEVKTLTVEIGEAYGDLPEATREGYDFLGWYTSKGKKVGSQTVVRVTKNHTLFAQWKEKNKPSFTVTFDPNAEELDTITVNVPEGDSYGTLPEVDREGYEFLGWFSAPTGGNKIKPDAPVTSDQTWYAHWDGFKYWNDTLSAAIDLIAKDTKPIPFYCPLGNDDALKSLAADCIGNPVGEDENPKYIVLFEDDMSKEKRTPWLKRTLGSRSL